MISLGTVTAAEMAARAIATPATRAAAAAKGSAPGPGAVVPAPKNAEVSFAPGVKAHTRLPIADIVAEVRCDGVSEQRATGALDPAQASQSTHARIVAQRFNRITTP